MRHPVVTNIVRSNTACSQNPTRCWMNISIDKLELFSDSDYTFECRINDEVYRYSCPVTNLRSVFDTHGVDIIKNPDRYSFYLDYRTGNVYSSVSANDKDVVVALERHVDNNGFSQQFAEVSPHVSMRTVYMDWLMENEYTPNTADSYASGVSTAWIFTRDVMKWDIADFFFIADADKMDEIIRILMKTREFCEMDEKGNRLRSNALKRYTEFLRQSQELSSPDNSGDVLPETNSEEGCKWKKLLQTVGITTFVKYYFVFKYYPAQKCVLAFEEDYTPASKNAKVSAAKTLFHKEMNIEALKYIRDVSGKVDEKKKGNAAWLLLLEE